MLLPEKNPRRHIKYFPTQIDNESLPHQRHLEDLYNFDHHSLLNNILLQFRLPNTSVPEHLGLLTGETGPHLRYL